MINCGGSIGRALSSLNLLTCAFSSCVMLNIGRQFKVRNGQFNVNPGCKAWRTVLINSIVLVQPQCPTYLKDYKQFGNSDGTFCKAIVQNFDEEGHVNQVNSILGPPSLCFWASVKDMFRSSKYPWADRLETVTMPNFPCSFKSVYAMHSYAPDKDFGASC